MLTTKLNFKQWTESEFGSAGPGIDDRPASEFPLRINKKQNQAFPQYDFEPLPGNCKPMKKQMKKQMKN